MNSGASEPRSASLFHRVYPLLIELWLLSVLLGFFVVRILGSGLGRRVLSAIGIRFAP
jgi:hypothetical protein